MNLSNRQQLLGIIAIVGVALLVGERLVANPLIRLWKDRAAEVARLRQSVQQGSQLLDRESVIRQRWSHMLSNALPTEVSAAESQVMRAFDQWSQESQISISGIKPQWKRGSSDDFATLECRVDAAGSLSQITRFLYEIEKAPMGLKLDLVQITASDDRGQQLTLGLQVSGLQLNPPPLP